MKKALLFMAGVAVAATAAFAEPAEQLYGIGDPFGGWDPTKGVEIAKVSDGVFKYEGELHGYFGFVSELAGAGDWTTLNAHRYNPDGGQAVKIGENKMRYGGQDSSWSAPEGTYTVTIDTNNMIMTVATDVEMVVSWAIHGALIGADWVTTNLEEGASGEWSTVINVVNAGEFGVKQMTNNDQTGWFIVPGDQSFVFNAENSSAVLGENGPNMTFGYPVPGEYKFSLDAKTMTLTITPDDESGIASVASDNVEAKYFNLQGVQVSNPENGLFIVVKGGKTSKVLVK